MAFERMTEYESVAGHAHAVPVADPDVAMMRLAAYEDTELSPEQIQEAVDILKSSFFDVDLPKELVSWVERCTWHVRKCNELRTQLDKYEALGTVEELAEMKFRLEGLEK